MVECELLPLSNRKGIIQIITTPLSQKGNGASCPVCQLHSALHVVLWDKEQHPSRLDLVQDCCLHMRLAAWQANHHAQMQR